MVRQQDIHLKPVLFQILQVFDENVSQFQNIQGHLTKRHTMEIII